MYSCAPNTETQLWSTALNMKVLSSASALDVVNMGISIDRGSLYVPATARTSQDKATLIFVKPGERSGAILYARSLPMEDELTNVLGPIVAYDNCVYLPARQRDELKYMSKQLRISVWGALVSKDGIVSLTWSPSSRNGPAVALTFYNRKALSRCWARLESSSGPLTEQCISQTCP